MIDKAAMREIVEGLYTTMIVDQHGSAGAVALKKLLLALHQIYDHVEPESVVGPIVVFKPLLDTERPLPEADALSVTDVTSLAQNASGPIAIQILDNGCLLLWRQYPISAESLAAVSVVYEYHKRNEYFYAKARKQSVPKFAPGFPSIFATPTFSELKTALEGYKTRMARHSSCIILAAAWLDGNRLFFRTKPESTMRNSLWQFLHSTLRAEVRPEQNVDETHPVDIKVTWTFSNRLALIEIKWLGASMDSSGAVTTKYTQSRALEGAQQLADYLDSNRRLAPNYITRGYLVVVDGRRKGLVETTKTVNRSDGMHYETKEIKYNPAFHRIREDFDEPIRFFIEPKTI